MINFLALYLREVRRFTKIWKDTIVSPVVSTVLFLAIFGVVMGDRFVGEVNYLAFMYAGLLTMTIIQSSFANPSFALVISKNIGTITDLQITPLTNLQIGIAYATAGATRAICTLALTIAVTIYFIPNFTVLHPLLAIVGMLLTGVQFGALGVMFGLYAKNFDSLPFITSFIMQPMIFLGGVFYPISTLPAPWDMVSMWNPLHHNINFLRYATLGTTDADPMLSLGVIAGCTLVFIGLMLYMLHTRLRD